MTHTENAWICLPLKCRPAPLRGSLSASGHIREGPAPSFASSSDHHPFPLANRPTSSREGYVCALRVRPVMSHRRIPIVMVAVRMGEGKLPPFAIAGGRPVQGGFEEGPSPSSRGRSRGMANCREIDAGPSAPPKPAGVRRYAGDPPGHGLPHHSSSGRCRATAEANSGVYFAPPRRTNLRQRLDRSQLRAFRADYRAIHRRERYQRGDGCHGGDDGGRTGAVGYTRVIASIHATLTRKPGTTDA
jgi:hypothetical protein